MSVFLNKGLRADNSTGYKGVTRTKTGFLARVQRQESFDGGGRRVFDLHRSVHPSAEEAAQAYDEAVRRIYGSDAPRFNFPKPGERDLAGDLA